MSGANTDLFCMILRETLAAMEENDSRLESARHSVECGEARARDMRRRGQLLVDLVNRELVDREALVANLKDSGWSIEHLAALRPWLNLDPIFGPMIRIRLADDRTIVAVRDSSAFVKTEIGRFWFLGAEIRDGWAVWSKPEPMRFHAISNAWVGHATDPERLLRIRWSSTQNEFRVRYASWEEAQSW